MGGTRGLRQGFVHNRTFSDEQSSHLIRHVRDMVLAARI